MISQVLSAQVECVILSTARPACFERLDSSPDETRTFEKGKIELAKLGDVTIGRATLEPGRRDEVLYRCHSKKRVVML